MNKETLSQLFYKKFTRLPVNTGEIEERLQKKEKGVNEFWHGLESRTPLQLACNHPHAEVARLLLEHPEIDPNKRYANDPTPLHFAVMITRGVHIIKMLLSHPSIDVTLKDEDGQTPLELAKKYGLNAVAQLIQAKINK